MAIVLITSSDPIGNQTRDLPACSAVPQPPVGVGLYVEGCCKL